MKAKRSPVNMSGSMGSDDQRIRNDDHDEGMRGPEISEADSDNGGHELNAMENPVKEMEARGEPQLEFEVDPQVDEILPNNEESPFPSPIPSQSPQHSPESTVDSASSSNIPMDLNRASDLLMAVSVGAEVNKTRIVELAKSAMEELRKKALGGESLWKMQEHSKIEVLNEVEYIREIRALDATLMEIMRMIEVEEAQQLENSDGNNEFANGRRGKSRFRGKGEQDALRTEASRDIGFVGMNPSSLVELLMDVKQWSSAFSNIVSSARVLGVLSTGVTGNYDGTLQVMRAEFYVPTPLVPVRECQFARYCEHIDSATWGIVDVSLENLFPNPASSFRRRPSGCLIQELPNGVSKVTWVEHVEVDITSIHQLFQPLFLSGHAFSAKRWLAALNRHCGWVAAWMSRSMPRVNGVLLSQNGKESVIRLAERMIRSFWQESSASNNNIWIPLPVRDADDFRVMSKSITLGPASDPTITTAFTSTLKLPLPPKKVFNFLRREDSRTKWDLLANGLVIRELTYIIKGENPENRTSVMQADRPPDGIAIMFLQETYTDPMASYVVYTPIDATSMEAILNGGNPEIVNILPSGFVVHPDGPVMNGEEANGSLLTIVFHIISNLPLMKGGIPAEAAGVIHSILTATATAIEDAILCDDP